MPCWSALAGEWAPSRQGNLLHPLPPAFFAPPSPPASPHSIPHSTSGGFPRPMANKYVHSEVPTGRPTQPRWRTHRHTHTHTHTHTFATHTHALPPHLPPTNEHVIRNTRRYTAPTAPFSCTFCSQSPLQSSPPVPRHPLHTVCGPSIPFPSSGPLCPAAHAHASARGAVCGKTNAVPSTRPLGHTTGCQLRSVYGRAPSMNCQPPSVDTNPCPLTPLTARQPPPHP